MGSDGREAEGTETTETPGATGNGRGKKGRSSVRAAVEEGEGGSERTATSLP